MTTLVLDTHGSHARLVIMRALLLDSHCSHAETVRSVHSLGSYDIVYFSETQRPHLDTLSAFGRISRMLSLLDILQSHDFSTLVLLGRGMSDEPREALDECARRAGVDLIYGADLLVDPVAPAFWAGGLCIIGDSCLHAAAGLPAGARAQAVAIPWCRIAPAFPGDAPLQDLLASWPARSDAYLLATPDNAGIATHLRHRDPSARIFDEHDLLALAIAERLREADRGTLRAGISERTDEALGRLRTCLGVAEADVFVATPPEPVPLTGPFAAAFAPAKARSG